MPDAVELEASVVIPTRSRWRLLSRAALPSALDQLDVEHEVVVVDDGSTDETAARLASMREPRLRVVSHEHALGVARARNAGIEAARGRWVSFLDDDDVWAPSKLRSQLDAAERAGAGLAYAAGAALDADLRFVYAVEAPDPGSLAQQLLRWNVIWCGCSNVLAQTALVRRLGGFDEKLFQLADWDLWIRLSLAAPAASVPQVLVGYVVHDENMVLTDRGDVFAELDYLVAKHGAEASRHGTAIDRVRFARWVGGEQRRAGRRVHAARTYLASAVRERDVGNLARALGSFVPEPVFGAARRALRTERRSLHAKLNVPEPEWISSLRGAASP